MATVCGCCLWPLFVANCLWLLFVATVCGCCLWLRFVATVCGYCLCLWLLFVAHPPLSSPLSTPTVLTRVGRRLVVVPHHPRLDVVAFSPLSSPVSSPLSSPAVLTRGPHHPRRSSAGRRRAPASILTGILTTILTCGPHHRPSSPPAVLTTRAGRRLVVVAPAPLSSPVSSPLSSPPVLTTRGPHPSGLKRSSEALEAAATVRAWGVATTGLCGLGGCSDCEGA